MKENKFERKRRLSKRREFLYIQKRGMRSFGKFLVVIGLKAKNLSCGRVGITIPKKVGKAHDRNLIKRRVRHILRLQQDLFLNKDIVVIIKENAITASFSLLEKDLIHSLEELHIKRIINGQSI